MSLPRIPPQSTSKRLYFKLIINLNAFYTSSCVALLYQRIYKRYTQLRQRVDRWHIAVIIKNTAQSDLKLNMLENGYFRP